MRFGWIAGAGGTLRVCLTAIGVMASSSPAGVAGTCISDAVCTPPACCAFSEPGTWTDASCGAGRIPGVDDTAKVWNSARPEEACVIYDLALHAVGGLDLYGSLAFDPSIARRDADGYRTLVVAGDVALRGPGPVLGGELAMGPDDRLGFDSTAGRRSVLIKGDGVRWNVRGLVHATTIAAIAVAPADAPTCGTTLGLKLTITPASGLDIARRGRRVVMQSGPAQAYQWEIAGVDPAGGALTVCTHGADNAASHQRLTPHVAYAGTRVFPVNRHRVPRPMRPSECRGPGVPEPECTGPGSGDIVPALPRDGDRIAIVRDVVLYDAAGGNGWTLTTETGGADPVPGLFGITMAGAASAPGQACVRLEGRNPAQHFEGAQYVNFHDHACGTGGIQFLGVRGGVLGFNACHDAAVATGGGDACLAALPRSGRPADDVVMEYNIAYRTRNAGLALGSGGVQSTNGRIRFNRLLDGATAASGRCSAIEINGMSHTEVAHNLVANWSRGDFPGEGGVNTKFCRAVELSAASPIVNDGTAVHHNWAVNMQGSFFQCGGSGTENRDVAITANYVSHGSGSGSGVCGSVLGNLIRNFGLLGNGDAQGIEGLGRRAMGNFILGVEDAIIRSPDCTTRGCARIGMNLSAPARVGIGGKVAVADNVITGLYSNYKVVTIGVNYLGGGIGTFSGTQAPEYDIDVDHNTVDGRGFAEDLADDGQVPDFVLRSYWENGDCGGDGCENQIHRWRDNVAMHANGAPAFHCAHGGLPGQTRVIGRLMRTEHALPPLDTGPITDRSGSECSSQASGVIAVEDVGYLDPGRGNYNLAALAPALTAGQDPPSSPIGVRAFRFSREALSAKWGGSLPFDGEQPMDVANVPNDDSDGDGVMDLHDNCDEVWNPSQWDGDRNGKGDACWMKRIQTVSSDPGDDADHADLQSAIDAAPAWATIIVSPGRGYHGTFTVDEGKALTITGSREGEVVVDGGAGAAFDLRSTSGSVPIIIRDLSITGRYGVVGRVPLRLEAVRVYGVTGDAVRLSAPATLENVLVEGGGNGIVLEPGGSVVLRHATIAGNAGIGIDNTTGGPVTVDRSILWGNGIADLSGVPCAAASWSDIDRPDCSAVNGNQRSDPWFTAGYRLGGSSPCLDAGPDASTYQGEPARDLSGGLRLRDHDGDGLARADLGAFEEEGPPAFPGEVAAVAWADASTLVWGPAPGASRYHVYRGALPGSYADFGSCRDELPGGLATASHVDVEVPPVGSGWHYHVTAAGPDGEEGTLGAASQSERSNFTPCLPRALRGFGRPRPGLER